LGIPFVGTRRTAHRSEGESWLAYDFPASDPSTVFREVLPTHVIFAARLTSVVQDAGDALAEVEHEQALRRLVRALTSDGANTRRTRMIYISSDAVFSNKRGEGPWGERDEPDTGTAYGRRQLCAEQVFAEEATDRLIVRCSYLCAGRDGPMDKDRRWQQLAREVAAGNIVQGATHLFKSPINVKSAARLVVRAALSSLTGVLHLPGERMSVFDFLAEGLRRLDQSDKRHLLQPCDGDSCIDTSLRSVRLGELT
jgi:dTDP-4-dehydrorhamnose reductase